jgi:hypothetical protein
MKACSQMGHWSFLGGLGGAVGMGEVFRMEDVAEAGDAGRGGWAAVGIDWVLGRMVAEGGLPADGAGARGGGAGGCGAGGRGAGGRGAGGRGGGGAGVSARISSGSGDGSDG